MKKEHRITGLRILKYKKLERWKTKLWKITKKVEEKEEWNNRREKIFIKSVQRGQCLISESWDETTKKTEQRPEWADRKGPTQVPDALLSWDVSSLSSCVDACVSQALCLSLLVLVISFVSTCQTKGSKCFPFVFLKMDFFCSYLTEILANCKILGWKWLLKSLHNCIPKSDVAVENLMPFSFWLPLLWSDLHHHH